MVDIVFLGTGDAFSAGRRTNSSLVIETSGLRMLVDAGPMVMHQLTQVGLRAAEIEQLFVSHVHADHALGFPIFALNRMGPPPPLHVYASVGTVTALRTLVALTLPGFGDDRLDLHWHELSEQGPDKVDLADNVTLRTVLVPHPRDVPTLAARWDFWGRTSVAFVTDTVPCEASVELARGCDLLIHEAAFSAIMQPDLDVSKYYHSTAQQAGEIARQAGCPRLVLVHLGAENGEYPDVLAEEARAGTDLQVTVPEDGERLSVNNEQRTVTQPQ